MTTAVRHDVVVDPEFGHRRLHPLPTEAEVRAFYEQRYYELVQAGQRGPDIRRLAEGGEAAAQERAWLQETLWADVRDTLATHGAATVLEVGCGTGDLLAHLAEHGLAVEGLELAPDAVAHAAARGLTVHAGDFLDDSVLGTAPRYDAVLFMNVLEQLRDPLAALRRAHALLRPRGIVIIRSGNDFNPLQLAAERALGCERWWVSAPDQLSYFSYDAMARLLEAADFRVVARQSDFPMELFLLLGDDYVRDRAVGRACHEKRRRLELALGPELRRRLYRAFADAGIGRCLFMIGQCLD